MVQPNFLHSGRFLVLVAFAEEERYAPESCKSNDGVDDARTERVVSAEDPGNGIELEKSHSAPVERANDRQNESNTVNDHR